MTDQELLRPRCLRDALGLPGQILGQIQGQLRVQLRGQIPRQPL